MKIQSIQQQNNNNSFRGIEKLTNAVAKHPEIIAGIAGSSAAAQKMVMSASEVAFAPAIDIGIGKLITKITDEKDGRTNQSSKVQAIRTFAQTVGGTITGVAIRLLCIGAATALLAKGGAKLGEEIATQLNKSRDGNLYEIQKNAAALGKNIGGFVATFVMMVTNFVLDVPIINYINKKVSDIVFKNEKSKEVKNVWF